MISFLVIQIYFFASFTFNLVSNDIHSGSLQPEIFLSVSL